MVKSQARHFIDLILNKCNVAVPQIEILINFRRMNINIKIYRRGTARQEFKKKIIKEQIILSFKKKT